jgi:AcrR family transcriptional regulator
MTMSDIANELGISKRTLYEVFQDKEELIEKCLCCHMEQTEREVEGLIARSEDVIDALMRIYAKHLQDVQKTSRSVLYDLKKYHGAVYKKMECRQREGMHVFLPLFERGIREGLIRADVNFEILTWLLKAQFRALGDDEYAPDDKYAPEEFLRTIILNFIRGIATPLGNEKVDRIVAQLDK